MLINTNGQIMHWYLNKFFITIAIVMAFSCKTTKSYNKYIGVLSSPITIQFKHKKGDQSEELQNIFNHHHHVTIVLDRRKTYKISDVISEGMDYLRITGNGSKFEVGRSKKVKSIITLIDPGKVEIENMVFSGNFPNALTSDFLFSVYTPNNVTDDVAFRHVKFINSDAGGVLVQNTYKNENFKSGAKSIKFIDCTVDNIGLNNGFKIRGSHKNVLFKGCIATDPLSRLHYSRGKMFDISAEVKSIDEVGHVVFDNCIIKNSNKGFFVQKTKHVLFKNILVDSMGHKPMYYKNGKKVGLVALKIDDLGKGNKAIIESFVVTNTAKSSYKYFLSLEETPKIGTTSHVVIKYFESDIGIRLGASGNHQVLGGILTGGSIRFQSENNFIKDVIFKNIHQYNSVEFLDQRNTISSCKFINANITLYKQAKYSSIIDCNMLRSKNRKFIILDLNDPKDPISLYVYNCTVPKGVLGIWSGGTKKQSKNFELRIDKRNKRFPLHTHIIESANIKIKQNNKW